MVVKTINEDRTTSYFTSGNNINDTLKVEVIHPPTYLSTNKFEIGNATFLCRIHIDERIEQFQTMQFQQIFTRQGQSKIINISSSKLGTVYFEGQLSNKNFDATVKLKESDSTGFEPMHFTISLTQGCKAILSVALFLTFNENSKLKMERGGELIFGGKELIFKAGSIIESELYKFTPSKNIVLTNYDDKNIHLFENKPADATPDQINITLKELSNLEKVSEFYKKLTPEKLKSYFLSEASALKAMISDKNSVEVSIKLIEAGLMNENYIYKHMLQLADLCNNLEPKDPVNSYFQMLPTELIHKIFSYVGLDGIVFSDADRSQ